MPTNRTALKRRRVSARGEALAWACLFETGWDFFDDLEPFGFDHADDTGKAAAAEAAWRRLGTMFLTARDPAVCNSVRPWALEQFGEP